MATVTGLTAERMLAIEGASVIDGDVVGDNLILTQHNGTQINAGNVRGPVGAAGPVGTDLAILTAQPVLDVGIAGQIRAGRQLTVADFTNMGLAIPIGLWNLSDLTDASGNGRAFLNKGAVPTGIGINGLASTSAQFSGQGTQSLYIPDTGAADPFRIKTGTIGMWFKCGKRGTIQHVLAKANYAVTSRSYEVFVAANNTIGSSLFTDPATTSYGAGSVTDVCDDRWHFFAVTFDASKCRCFIDSKLHSENRMDGPLNGAVGPLTLGGLAGDSTNPNINPFFGRVDELFITSDVLSEDEIRVLYCAKLAHSLGSAPSRISLNVHRRRKGAALAVADFATQPLRLYNFSAGSVGDEGSNGVALNPFNVSSVSGADGSGNNGYNSPGGWLSATDAGLPSGLTARSYGGWFKTVAAIDMNVIAWGTVSTGDCRMLVTAAGYCSSINGADGMGATYFVRDGYWHHAVVVEDNAGVDAKRKLYIDGQLVGVSTGMVPVVLTGSAAFRIGANSVGGSPFFGQVDGVFVCGYALTPEDVIKLYAKGSQTLASSPKNAGDHIEALTATSLLAAFDTLESQHTVDLMVAP